MDKMKKTAFIVLLIPILLCACVREVWPEQDVDSDELVFSFGSAPSLDVVVSTKSTLSVQQESQVKNMYVFIFDEADKKVYGHFFDDSNKGSDKGALPNWWISSTNDEGETTGTVHIKTPKKNKCKIVAICNMDSEMVDISPEFLSMLTNYSDLQELKLKLNQQIISRNGFFPMVGEIPSGDNVDENAIDLTPDSSIDNPIVLENMTLRRLDAKIKFIVRADNESGLINNFTPISWQVIHLPKFSYLLPRNGKDDAADVADHFFDSEESVFETETKPSDNKRYRSGSIIPEHGFSFYMMENRKAPKNDLDTWTYADRDRQTKEPTTSRNNDEFENANDLATYVILRGRLELKEDTGVNKVAEVRYVIHLGNFATNFGDFDIERNHTYIYNVFIQNVEDIRVEVQGEDDGEGGKTYPEKEPGATGDILISDGKTILCDSHYNAYAIDFFYNNIDEKRMNWWVQTPFNPDGADPESVNLSGIDYGWVEFRVNTKDNTGSYPPNTLTTYLPRQGSKADKEGNGDGKTMTLPELMQFLKDEKAKYDTPDWSSSAFDNRNDLDRAKITVTAFINEFYYETNPLTGQYEPDLWRRFVNQPMRTMCILSNVEQSADKESRVVSSSFTIQQRSIQSVYNVNKSDLKSGWGVEFYRDAREQLCEASYTKNIPGDITDRKNTDPDNGRRNTMIEWGLMGSNPDTYSFQEKNWGTYLNWTDGYPDHSMLKDPYDRIRYSCLSRNRDNDGDGKIDKDEVRWYLASSNQLISLFLGSYGIDGDAGLYQCSLEERTTNNTAKWRQHVLASNRGSDYLLKQAKKDTFNSNTMVRTIWAEEGLTGSWIDGVPQEGANGFSARCVRNFGYDPITRDDITYSPEDTAPDALLIINRYHETDGTPYEGNWTDGNFADVYFDVDCTRLNERSLRYYTDRELIPHDEHSEAACLYKRFQTTSIVSSITVNQAKTIENVNKDIDQMSSNPYCPTGYRLPNIREIGVMCYFFDRTDNEGEIFISYNLEEGKVKSTQLTFARTRYSFGSGGNHFDNKWGWGIGAKDGRFRAFMGTSTNTPQNHRCVKDVKVE